MATRRESIQLGLQWCVRMLRIAVRRAVIIGVLAGLFALAVIYTTRERVSDCSDVTPDQRAALAALIEPDASPTLGATASATCVDGEYSAPLTGYADTMEAATHQVEREGWVHDTNYIAFFDQLWRRCFRRTEPGMEQVQLTIDASRGGSVIAARVTAPENVQACELERRDESEIYPPRES